MNKQKSLNRQLKRGRAKYFFFEKIVRWENNTITGILTPIINKIPVLCRKTNRGGYLPI